MPNWDYVLIQRTVSLAIACSIVCTFVYNVFAFSEDRLSINVKESISIWLKSTGNSANKQILSFNLARFHGQLFGDKQFSLKCVRRSIILSFISFFLMSFPIVAWKAVIIYKYGLLPIDFYIKQWN